MDLSEESTLRAILRERPRSAELLEAALGPAIWNELERPLAEHARERGRDAAALLAEIASLERVPDGTDWATAPLYDLVDFLTGDHRRYSGRFLEGIGAQLDATDQEEYPAWFSLADFRVRFHAFLVDFRVHMEEEEGYLFPMALRLEACARHPEISPEIYRGSIGAYFADMLRTPEIEIKSMLGDLRGIAIPRDAPTSAALDGLGILLEDFLQRVTRHATLEIHVLVPRAEAMERLLRSRLEQMA